MFDEVWQGVAAEFSDLPSLTSITRLSVRMLLGALLGGLIGFERERKGKDAGLRTHMLVCIGTAFVIAAPEQAKMPLPDMSRIIQGVMAGVGFLGAGAIMKYEDKGRIEGLTTAASIWFTAAIGIAVGLGREASAVVGTLFALGILAVLPDVSKKSGAKKEAS